MISYDNSSVRRQDRLLEESVAIDLLRSGEYGFLAMATEQGGYGVPMNYAVADDVIYMHCAVSGRKLRAIEYDNRVSFVVVGKTQLCPSDLTTKYQSVIAEGGARVVTSDEERAVALKLIVEKYAPQYASAAAKAMEISLSRTVIVAVKIERLAGKQKGM